MNRTILMLEHDEDDRYITQRVFDELNYQIKLDFVTSGDSLFQYLRKGVDSNLKSPSLILLNYHIAPTTAVDIIKQLKADKNVHHIPIVVLSGSVTTDVIRECYDAGASSFIQKPWRADQTNEKISNFFRYWFETVQLP